MRNKNISKNMNQRVVLIFAVTMTVAVAAGISLLAKLMAPIKKGTPGELWYAACNIALDPNDKHEWRGQVVLQDGWFIYELTHLHGESLFRIRKSEAMKDFPRVIKQLDAECANADPNDYFLSGYIEWKVIEESERNGVEGLLERIEQARAGLLRSRFPELDRYTYFQRYILKKRLQQAKWYWANILFEFVFLSGLIWFAIWPIIKRKNPFHWALHLGLVPLLFMLPLYLGYSTYTRTSAGPSGGVLYPWIVFFLPGGPPNNVEQVILERLPQILEPLSQGIGTPMALTGRGMPRPTIVLGCSVVMAIIAFTVSWWTKHRSKINSLHE
jgi:hypothetical protein